MRTRAGGEQGGGAARWPGSPGPLDGAATAVRSVRSVRMCVARNCARVQVCAHMSMCRTRLRVAYTHPAHVPGSYLCSRSARAHLRSPRPRLRPSGSAPPHPTSHQRTSCKARARRLPVWPHHPWRGKRMQGQLVVVGRRGAARGRVCWGCLATRARRRMRAALARDEGGRAGCCLCFTC